MKNQDRKLSIVRQFEKEQEPVTLAELVSKLDFSCADRTVRRYLSQLLEEGIVQKFGHTKGAKYASAKRLVNKIDQNLLATSEKEKNYIPTSESSCFSAKSQVVIEKIRQLLFKRQPVTYDNNWLHPYERRCLSYNSAIKALCFDEVRVRYRQPRRDIIREVILRGMNSKEVLAYIKKSEQLIPEKDRKAFAEDVIEDLDQIDQSRIAGLGITPRQLDDWLLLCKEL